MSENNNQVAETQQPQPTPPPNYQNPPNNQPTIIINNTNANTNTATVNTGTAGVQKKKTTALILCLLGFIGLAGIHRFYTGKSFSGLVYLLTLGLGGIGTIFDLIMILIGSFRDRSGAPLQ